MKHTVNESSPESLEREKTKQKSYHCWPPRAGERTRRTGPSRLFDEGEKRKGRCCDEQRMKSRQADKQPGLSVRVWYFRDSRFLPGLVPRLLQPPPHLSGRLIPAQTLAQRRNLSPASITKSTHALPNLGYKWAVSFSSRLFVSLFPPIMFALCFSSPLFFCFCLSLFIISASLSLFSLQPFFSPPSPNPRVPLRLYSPPRFISGFRLF